MDCVQVGTSFSWIEVGALSLDLQGKIKFPKVAATPGLYRFDISSIQKLSQYIGETDQLARRFQHYRTPGPTQQTNIRLNGLFIEHLKRGDQISLSVVTDDVVITCAGQSHRTDLSVKSERILIEAAALFSARAAGIQTLNL